MLSMKKHARSGHAVNSNHFTGMKGSDTDRKRKSSRRMRKMKRGTHINKYRMAS